MTTSTFDRKIELEYYRICEKVNGGYAGRCSGKALVTTSLFFSGKRKRSLFCVSF